VRICIIGTSHASCLYTAWNKISSDYPDVSISFYFNGGGYFGKFQADTENSVLRINDDNIRKRFVQLSGGDGSIDFSTFDMCVIIGGFFYLPVGRLAALGDETRFSFSKQVKEAATEDLFSRIHVNGLIPVIREVSEIPIFLIHDPFQTLKPTLPIEDMVNPFESYNYENGVKLLNKVVLSPIKVKMLLQPSETLDAPYFSKREFAQGKRKATPAEIEAGHVGEFIEDNHHLNANYGELSLNDCCRS